MNIKEIKELINLMNENDLDEIEIEKENGKIRLSKKKDVEKVQVTSPVRSSEEAKTEKTIHQEVIEDTGNLEEIVSPMVGVFYRAPSPDADAFVEEGYDIKEGDVLCIIEAMKVMNEIKSEISGKIKKILVDNGKQVEYNQPLFLVEKS